MSEVRGRAGRTPCLKGSKQPRGVIPRPRSGAAAKSTRLRRRRNGPEELSCVRGQGWRREELPRVGGQGRQPEGDTPHPKPKARGGGREEKPHARGQGQWLGGPTPGPRSRSCAGAGGPRGDIPCCRSGRTAVRRYPSSKVRSNGCILLQQP